jgi:hypothetical protein
VNAQDIGDLIVGAYWMGGLLIAGIFITVMVVLSHRRERILKEKGLWDSDE